MSETWQQACATWRLYSEALAGLEAHLDDLRWQLCASVRARWW